MHASQRITLLALVLTLVSAAVAQQAPASPDADKQAVRSALEQSAAEWNKGNLDGYMTVYWNSPDVTFSAGANITRGYQETLARYKRGYQSPGREMGKLDYQDVNIDILCPDTAFVRGRWHLKESTGKEPHGVFTLLMKKFPEGWKIVHDHSSGE